MHKQAAFKADIRHKGEENSAGIERAGHPRHRAWRESPYHIDPHIHHGIPDMINTLGLAVLTGRFRGAF
jgi:predicted nucleotide-binding protein (sugar kinase/HSP70/actin superfamily)